MVPECRSICTFGYGNPYSHSIVLGGFELISYTTRLTPFTSLIIREDMRARIS